MADISIISNILYYLGDVYTLHKIRCVSKKFNYLAKKDRYIVSINMDPQYYTGYKEPPSYKLDKIISNVKKIYSKKTIKNLYKAYNLHTLTFNKIENFYNIPLLKKLKKLTLIDSFKLDIINPVYVIDYAPKLEYLMIYTKNFTAVDIVNCEHLKILHIYHVPILNMHTTIKYLKELSLDNINDIEELYDMPNLEKLICKYTSIRLIDNMSNLTNLILVGNPYIQISEFPKLKIIDIENCISIKEIPAYKNLEQFSFRCYRNNDKMSILKIGSLPNLKKFQTFNVIINKNFIFNKNIESIIYHHRSAIYKISAPLIGKLSNFKLPDLPKLSLLDIDELSCDIGHLTSLKFLTLKSLSPYYMYQEATEDLYTQISKLQNLRSLTIQNTIFLKEIPYLENLKNLYCINVPIRKIPNMKTLGSLMITHSEYDIEFPKEFDSILSLICNNCINLSKLPIMNKIKSLSILNCKKIKKLPLFETQELRLSVNHEIENLSELKCKIVMTE